MQSTTSTTTNTQLLLALATLLPYGQQSQQQQQLASSGPPGDNGGAHSPLSPPLPLQLLSLLPPSLASWTSAHDAAFVWLALLEALLLPLLLCISDTQIARAFRRSLRSSTSTRAAAATSTTTSANNNHTRSSAASVATNLVQQVKVGHLSAESSPQVAFFASSPNIGATAATDHCEQLSKRFSVPNKFLRPGSHLAGDDYAGGACVELVGDDPKRARANTTAGDKRAAAAANCFGAKFAREHAPPAYLLGPSSTYPNFMFAFGAPATSGLGHQHHALLAANASRKPAYMMQTSSTPAVSGQRVALAGELGLLTTAACKPHGHSDGATAFCHNSHSSLQSPTLAKGRSSRSTNALISFGRRLFGNLSGATRLGVLRRRRHQRRGRHSCGLFASGTSTTTDMNTVSSCGGLEVPLAAGGKSSRGAGDEHEQNKRRRLLHDRMSPTSSLSTLIRKFNYENYTSVCQQYEKQRVEEEQRRRNGAEQKAQGELDGGGTGGRVGDAAHGGALEEIISIGDASESNNAGNQQQHQQPHVKLADVEALRVAAAGDEIALVSCRKGGLSYDYRLNGHHQPAESGSSNRRSNPMLNGLGGVGGALMAFSDDRPAPLDNNNTGVGAINGQARKRSNHKNSCHNINGSQELLDLSDQVGSGGKKKELAEAGRCLDMGRSSVKQEEEILQLRHDFDSNNPKMDSKERLRRQQQQQNCCPAPSKQQQQLRPAIDQAKLADNNGNGNNGGIREQKPPQTTTNKQSSQNSSQQSSSSSSSSSSAFVLSSNQADNNDKLAQLKHDKQFEQKQQQQRKQQQQQQEAQSNKKTIAPSQTSTPVTDAANGPVANSSNSNNSSGSSRQQATSVSAIGGTGAINRTANDYINQMLKLQMFADEENGGAGGGGAYATPTATLTRDNGADSLYNYSTWRSVDDALSLVSVSSEFEYHNINQSSPFQASQQAPARQAEAAGGSGQGTKATANGGDRLAEAPVRRPTESSESPSQATESKAVQQQQQKPTRPAKNVDDMRFPSFLATQNDNPPGSSSPLLGSGGVASNQQASGQLTRTAANGPNPMGSATQSSSLLNITAARYSLGPAAGAKSSHQSASLSNGGAGANNKQCQQVGGPAVAQHNQANGTITKQRAKLGVAQPQQTAPQPQAPVQIKYQNLGATNGAVMQRQQQLVANESLGNVRARIMRMEQRQLESGRKQLLVSTPNLSLLAGAGRGQQLLSSTSSSSSSSFSLAASSNRASVGGGVGAGRRVAATGNQRQAGQSAAPSASLIPVPVFGSGRHLATGPLTAAQSQYRNAPSRVTNQGAPSRPR